MGHVSTGKMQAFPAIRSSELSSLPGAAFFRPRTQLTFPNKLFFCRAKYAESGNAGLHNLIFAPANPLVTEKEEAKAVLTLFLKKQGLSNAVAARTVDKSALFIDHLVSRIHSVHKNRYPGGQELTTLEIRDALNPYLETLYEEFGDILVDVVENFPNPATEERSTENLSIPSLEEEPVSAPITTLNSKKLKALARLTDDGLTGKPPPHIIYLTALGMEIEVIEEVTSKFPSFAYYSLDRKIKPVVEVLLDLGIPKSDIPTILSKRPHLCGIRQTEKLLIPTITYLKNLGMDKKQLTKAICRFPALLTCSRQKLESTIDLLYELGLPAEHLGKVLTRGPQILGYSGETLKARAKYFHSIGVDVGSLLYRYPTIFGLNIETHLKPLTEFFLEKGFSTADIASMISGFGSLCTFSLSNNIMPKWEFFLTMCYPKSDLVKVPQYFVYSLELRIKPRYATMRESEVTLSLGRLLYLSDGDLDKVLKQKMNKHVG
ncbi:transcription termination factor MTERF5, chloroplastic-like isoform X2 [Rhododendron vialii]|uniref:transcription termination factor MTERF5, chloroplastic-like isoform X2 n=1 Tax=Rhododendron vialii TaxID=182163 RepID=UPI00265FD741|nr:transcription termination factor MTERF5, chloroplastic-like isoform X2 [Rhododendron vialii]